MDARVLRAMVIAAVVLTAAGCGDEDTTATAEAKTANQPPVIGGSPSTTVVAEQTYDFKPTASDPDGDPIVFGIDGKPGWMTFDTSTGELSGKPHGNDVGKHRGIVIWVSDGESETLMPTLDVEVLPAPTTDNQPPEISGTPPGSVAVGEFYDFVPTVVDPEGDPMSFTIDNRPAWADFDAAIGRLSGTPGTGDVGDYANIVISVSDGTSTSSLGPFLVVVNPPPSQNSAPVISGQPDSSVTVGNAYAFTPSASDADGDTLRFTIFNQPGWSTFNTATGALTGSPASADAGTYGGISIVVSDGQASAALPGF